MNRTLARAVACALALIVSFAPMPLVRAQEPAGSAQAPTPVTAPTQPAGQAQGNSEASPQESTPSSHQPPVELP